MTVNLRMPGQYYDLESGLFYNWNRYYNPEIGRYISSDPIGLDGGINTFLYAEANPVMYVDPEGLASNPSCVAVARACGAAIGRTAGRIGGATLGAGVGTVGAPGAGTVAGGIIGGQVGGIGGGLVGGQVGSTVGNVFCPILTNESSGDDPQYPNNPDNDKENFRPVRGSSAKENTKDGSVWDSDKSQHGGPQWKRWPDKRAWERGDKPQSIWPDGRVRK